MNTREAECSSCFIGAIIGTYKSPNPYSNLAVWSVNKTKAGKIKSVTEFIDMTTGEVIPAATIQATTLDLRDKQAKKDAVLADLRPEVREFAYFVLGYANKRRGITPGINTLCHWYDDLTGKRADNIRRYIPTLEAAGILAGENLLGRLFQRTGGSACAHLDESSQAEARYRLQKALQILCMDHRTNPAWLADATPTGNLLTYEAYCELMQRVGLPVAHTPHGVACAHPTDEPAAQTEVLGLSFRKRVRGMSADSLSILLSGYFSAWQRQRLHVEPA